MCALFVYVVINNAPSQIDYVITRSACLFCKLQPELLEPTASGSTTRGSKVEPRDDSTFSTCFIKPEFLDPASTNHR